MKEPPRNPAAGAVWIATRFFEVDGMDLEGLLPGMTMNQGLAL
jgi:hypothetical protein